MCRCCNKTFVILFVPESSFSDHHFMRAHDANGLFLFLPSTSACVNTKHAFSHLVRCRCVCVRRMQKQKRCCAAELASGELEKHLSRRRAIEILWRFAPFSARTHFVCIYIAMDTRGSNADIKMLRMQMTLELCRAKGCCGAHLCARWWLLMFC